MKIIILIIAIYTYGLNYSFAQIIDTCTKSGSLIVVDESSHKIVFENNSDKLIYPASLVKLMTAYLVLEAIQNKKISLDKNIYFSPRAEEVSKVNKYNTLNIKVGDKISVENALIGLIVKSYNENAVALAEAISMNEWSFVRLMNKKALELGMINTSFRNASGLHEEGQYTTALDLAKLALRLKIDFPSFYGLFSEKEFSYKNISSKSNNRFLYEYEGAEGMKTGFTSASGYNLVATAKRNDYRLFSVVTGCENSLKRF
ncbi:MAG: D-alanyl-D-alanine carboxypeptidase, partial [Proteobacteria bacterium]|nr:D-alanyl-D-alanine carboxypeptidase [Pseudomonadota bacterium]